MQQRKLAAALTMRRKISKNCCKNQPNVLLYKYILLKFDIIVNIESGMAAFFGCAKGFVNEKKKNFGFTFGRLPIVYRL